MNNESLNSQINPSSLKDAFDAWEPDFQEDLLWNELNDSLDIEYVWAKLDDSLELEQIWNKVEISLNQEIVSIKPNYWKSFGLITFFVFFAILWLRDESSDTQLIFQSMRENHVEHSKVSMNESIEDLEKIEYTTDKKIANTEHIQPSTRSTKPNFVLSDFPQIPQENEIEPNTLVNRLSIHSVEQMEYPMENMLTWNSDKFKQRRSNWHVSLLAGMNLTAMRVQNPRELASFVPQVASQFGVELSYQKNKNRYTALFDFAENKMKENRYINGKYGSIYHAKYQFSGGLSFARIIFPNTEVHLAGVVSLPYRALSTREDLIVGLPKTAVEWGGQIGISYYWTKNISTSIQYRLTQTDKQQTDWNQTRQGVLNLRYTF